MNIKIISGLSFGIAMLLAVLLLLDVSVPFLSRVYMVYGVIGLGAVGMILNLLNVRESKHSTIYSIVYWCACLLLIAGVGMKLMHYPYSKWIIQAGFLLLFVSFFMPKYRKETSKEETELLDDI